MMKNNMFNSANSDKVYMWIKKYIFDTKAHMNHNEET